MPRGWGRLLGDEGTIRMGENWSQARALAIPCCPRSPSQGDCEGQIGKTKQQGWHGLNTGNKAWGQAWWDGGKRMC